MSPPSQLPVRYVEREDDGRARSCHRHSRMDRALVRIARGIGQQPEHRKCARPGSNDGRTQATNDRAAPTPLRMHVAAGLDRDARRGRTVRDHPSRPKPIRSSSFDTDGFPFEGSDGNALTSGTPNRGLVTRSGG